MIVTKFGGRAMANAESIRQVASILRANSDRQLCVVSAPGREGDTPKMTDVLMSEKAYTAHERFVTIIEELGLCPQALTYLDKVWKRRGESEHMPTRLSFGEHMSAYVLAKYLGWRFIDSTLVIRFTKAGMQVAIPYKRTPAVIPGFYGLCTVTQKIALFPRGGSDITGAHIAAKSRADMYENWTDVNGVYDADPNHVPSAMPHKHLSYAELMRISRGGAQVYHRDAILPLARKGIPIHIRNTFAPDEAGTIVA